MTGVQTCALPIWIVGEQLIARELQEIERNAFFTDKRLLPTFMSYYKRIAAGERDLYM